jgi:hypothetical protein
MRNKKLANESMGAKPKERSKTGIARKLAMGVPLVASASGVKGGRGANRAFGAITGITAAKSGIKVDPLALVSMALPVGKLIAAAKALKAAGKIKQAEALAARVAAKTLGGSRAAVRGVRQERTLFYPRNNMSGSDVRGISESVYPRLPNIGGDSPRLLRGSRDLRTFDTYADPINEGAGRFARGTKRGNKLVSAITRNEVQGGMYIGTKEAIKLAAFNSRRLRSNLPK